MSARYRIETLHGSNWEAEPNGVCASEEEGERLIANLCETCGYDPSRFRVVEVQS